ncbi:MAG: FeoA family protein [Candidatus Thorarchaeota archaeon]|jgi:ferrous iron transport protein A
MSEDVEQIAAHGETKSLTEVSPGSKCTLVGIERFGPRKHPPRKNHHPGKSGNKKKHRHQGPFPGTRRHWFGRTEEDDSDPDCPYRHSRRPFGRGLMRRLVDLGITKGYVFTVVQSGGSGPVLIEVRGTRIALGNGMACRILVKEVS